MKSFDFYLPTKVLFGKGRISEFSKNIDSRWKRILVVTDKKVAKKSGAVVKTLEQLYDKEVTLFTDVEENPPLAVIEKGRQRAKEYDVQLVIGIGGGSPMDAAKGIAVLATNKGDMRDYMKGRALDEEPLPIVCIPTTSGTGSEVTPYAVFTDAEDQTKGGYSHPKIFPHLSIVDPELSYSMPKKVVINTGLDAMTHAIEAYLSTEAFPLNDVLAIQSIEVILKNLKKASTGDEEAMTELSYASMLAGIAITHGGTILLHIMAYPLTVFHQIPHGKANAILLAEFMAFMRENSSMKQKVRHLDHLFKEFGGVDQFVIDFNISTHLSSYGIQEKEIKTFVEKVIVKEDVKITPAVVTEDEIANIYRAAM